MGQSSDTYAPFIKGLESIVSQQNLQTSMTLFGRLLQSSAKSLSGKDMRPIYWIRDKLQAHLFLQEIASIFHVPTQNGNIFDKKYVGLMQKMKEISTYAQQKEGLPGIFSKVSFREMSGMPNLKNKVEALVGIVEFCQVLLKNLGDPKMDPNYLNKFQLQVRKTTHIISKYAGILIKNKQTDGKIKERQESTIKEINAKYPDMKLHPSSQFATLFKSIEMSFEKYLAQKSNEITFIKGYINNLYNNTKSCDDNHYFDICTDGELKNRLKMLKERLFTVERRNLNNGFTHQSHADHNEFLCQKIEDLQRQIQALEHTLEDTRLANQTLRGKLSQSQQQVWKISRQLQQTKTDKIKLEGQNASRQIETETMLGQIQSLKSSLIQIDSIPKLQTSLNLLSEENSQLKKQVTTLKEYNHGLWRQNSLFVQKISELQYSLKENEQVKRKMQANEAQLEQLSRLEAEHLKQIDRLRSFERQSLRINQLSANLIKLESEQKESVDTIHQLNKRNQELQRECYIDRQQINGLQGEASTLQIQIQSKEEQNRKLNHELISLKGEIERLTKINNEGMEKYSANDSQTQSQLLSLNFRISKLEREKQENESDLQKALIEVTKVAAEREQLMNKIKVYIKEKTALQNEKLQLEQQIDRMKAKIIQLQLSERENQGNLQLIRDEKNRIEDDHNLITQNMEAIKEDKRKLQETNGGLNKQIKTLEQEKALLLRRIQDISGENQKSNHNSSTLQQSVYILTAGKRQLEQKLYNKTGELNSVVAQLNSMKQTKQNIEIDYRNLQVLLGEEKTTKVGLKNEIQRLSNEIIDLGKQIESISFEKSKFEADLNLQKQQVRTLETEKQMMETSNMQLKQEVDDIKRKETDYRSKLESLEVCLKEKQYLLSDLKQELMVEKNKIKQMTVCNQGKQSALNNLTRELTVEKARIKELEQNAESQTNQIRRINCQISRLNLQKQSLQQKCDDLILRYDQEVKTKADALRQLEELASAKEASEKHWKSIIEGHSSQISKLTQELEEKTNEIGRLKTQIEKLTQKYDQASSQNAELRGIHLQLQEQKMCLDPRIYSLFVCDIFEDQCEEKLKLISHIEDYMNKKIVKSKLLYKFDPLNPTNLHKYIDDKPGLLCVVKTKNAVVAGFYPGALREKGQLNEGALIISVTNNKSYRLMEKTNKMECRGMIYDPYYVIFGNSDLSLKGTNNEVFSKLSSWNNQKVDLLNEGALKTTFETCQYYQLFFESEQPQ